MSRESPESSQGKCQGRVKGSVLDEKGGIDEGHIGDGWHCDAGVCW